MTNPEYPMSSHDARIALMREPEGTIIESNNHIQFKLQNSMIFIRDVDTKEEWFLRAELPSLGIYRIIPLPEPPHVNPTFEELMKCKKFKIEWPEPWASKLDAPYSAYESSRKWGLFDVTIVDLALRVGAKVTILEGGE